MVKGQGHPSRSKVKNKYTNKYKEILVSQTQFILSIHLLHTHNVSEPAVTQADPAGSQRSGVKESSRSEPVIIEGLESGTVIGIAFAAFIIGAMMMGLLWFIHSHSGSCMLDYFCAVFTKVV